jgi:hypothetical protein
MASTISRGSRAMGNSMVGDATVIFAVLPVRSFTNLKSSIIG